MLLAALLALATPEPPTLSRLGVISVHPGTVPPRDIRQALRLGYALNWLGADEQAALAGDGCRSIHFAPRPGAELLHEGLGITRDDLDQDADGNLAAEGYQMATFDPRVIERSATILRDRLAPGANAPWVAAVSVPSPISRYGEMHYAVSEPGGYLTFSRPAQESFRRWLRDRYLTVEALSEAWGEPVEDWASIVPPRGPLPGPSGIDPRPAWSDYLHWYNDWLLTVTRTTLAAVREVTDRPLHVTLGGMKVGYAQGVFAGNVGPTVKLLAGLPPCLLDDTDAQTLYSLRYTSTACAQYGVRLMCEPVGPPHLSEYAQLNTLVNALAAGCESIILPHLGELNQADHFFTRAWARLAPVFDRYETIYQPSEAAFFHSYVTSWYRADRQNLDGVMLYDATNTNWSPDPSRPSWGRALGSPDVLDEQMIAEGGLTGRRLLIIPNSGVTVTTRAAVDAIGAWVRAGGTLVAFGEGCLAWTVEPDRRLAATPDLAGLLVDPPASPRVEQALGRGTVIFYRTPADPGSHDWFCRSMVYELPVLARRAGVRSWCRIEPQGNVLYCGLDQRSGRHLFVADLLTRTEPVTFADGLLQLSFDSRLRGEAELVAVTDRFTRCTGGAAEYDTEARVLTVRFTLPGRLAIEAGG